MGASPREESQLERRKKDRLARDQARTKYWSEHSKERYECPDCGCGMGETRRFEVHHRDGNPRNNEMCNLVALCFECHLSRHGAERQSYTVDEWKDRFLSLG